MGKLMKLYLISIEYIGYETYDSAVVAAESEDDARHIHPDGKIHPENSKWVRKLWDGNMINEDGEEWVKFSEIDSIDVEYLGETNKERGVILASFNAG
jgi:hypothetical protein